MARSARISAGTCWLLGCLFLLAGGDHQQRTASISGSSAEFGRAGEWTALPTAPLSARYEADGVWVADRFVVIGGWSSSICPPNASCIAPSEPPLHDGASFDPATGRWTRIADAPVPVTGLNAVVVDDRLYTLTSNYLGRADSPAAFLSYAPDQNAWTTHPLPSSQGSLVGAGSSVVLIGSSDEREPAVDLVFDAEANSWQRLPDDPLGPSSSRAAVWVGESLLLAAGDLVPDPGSERPVLVRVARLDATLSQWSMLPDSQIIGYAPVSVAGLAVWPYTGSANGGEVGNWGRSYPEGGIFDPSIRAWLPLPTPSTGWRPSCCEGAVIGERVMIGRQLLDPVTGHWSSVPALPGEPRTSATVVGSPRSLLVWGGAAPDPKSSPFAGPKNQSTGYLWRPPTAAS